MIRNLLSHCSLSCNLFHNDLLKKMNNEEDDLDPVYKVPHPFGTNP